MTGGSVSSLLQSSALCLSSSVSWSVLSMILFSELTNKSARCIQPSFTVLCCHSGPELLVQSSSVVCVCIRHKSFPECLESARGLKPVGLGLFSAAD